MDLAAPPLAVVLDAVIVATATGLAAWVRPWRSLGRAGPPWPWLALLALLPLLWGLDRYTGVRILPALSGAPLAVLMAGWPLAVLSMLPAAAVTAAMGDLDGVDALQRLVWLGLVPATFMLAIGAALRRWLPAHLFVYILGRGFLGTLVALLAAGAAATSVGGAGAASTGLQPFAARVLAAFGEAFLTGMATAILVAFRPDCLATYADRLYLPPAPRE